MRGRGAGCGRSGAGAACRGAPGPARPWGMAGRSRRSWLSVLLGLVLGFVLASRLILPRASELKKAGHRRQASPEGCGGRLRGDPRAALLWRRDPAAPPRDDVPPADSFLFVGVMTAQKYLQSRAVAAHR